MSGSTVPAVDDEYRVLEVENGALRKFGPQARARFLRHLASGHGRFAAAKIEGISWDTVKRYRRANPEFREAMEEAELEASEVVEDKLFAAAKEGEPWAVSLWLKHRAAARWGEKALTVKHEHSGTVEVSVAAAIAEIETLKARLVERAAVAELEAGDIIDAVVLEDLDESPVHASRLRVEGEL